MLNWNEIRIRATEFAHNWRGESREGAEAQSFWNDFFNVFGKSRRAVAIYEKSVQLLEKRGRIDLFWQGMLLVEHKSRGENLQNAEKQALEYLQGIAQKDIPRYYLLCDFNNFILYDLDNNKNHEFYLSELPDNIHLFGFIAGRKEQSFAVEKFADIKASELMGDIYTALEESNYQGDKDTLLVRLLFCLFAEDTGIFEPKIFQSYLENHTNEDGSDLGAQLEIIFDALNSPKEKRQTNLDEDLQQFPYVNGDLFKSDISIASFDSTTRATFLRACDFNWSAISPAIFGALFQSIRDPQKRRSCGEHYTSESNILKIIRPLFLDELHKEYEHAANRKTVLQRLHDKIAKLTFLDPACGCGNFLIVAYRELRLLEIEILNKLYPKQRGGGRSGLLNISDHCKINVDSFYGIEIEEFPARIAQVAMWLVDHQMNKMISEVFGEYYIRIPLTTSPNIICGNALRLDWNKTIAPQKLSYILGNPPFVGKQYRTEEQRQDMNIVFGNAKGFNRLDYVSAWYVKVANYIYTTDIRCAFVSTNSITQGNQVAVLWGLLYQKGVKIHFAHRTFIWNNEVIGNAQVHVVIIGFGNTNIANKIIYDYPDTKSEPQVVAAATINAYLTDAADILVEARKKPLCNMPPMNFGSMPNDGGHLLFSNEQKEDFLRNCPEATQYIKPFIGAEEFINDITRWCLWLKDVEPENIRKIRPITERINNVRIHRKNSPRLGTRNLAKSPGLFGEIRQPNSDYILMPLTSSENRDYVPVGFASKEIISNNAVLILPSGNLYDFGIISSAMHMAWMRAVCGRLESRYRYSNTLVYNTFPCPQDISEAQKATIKACSAAILETRKNHKGSTLADMYSPLSMPNDLLKAHHALDKAVDLAYRRQPFKTERNRLEYLFAEYRKLTAPIEPIAKKRRTRRKL